MTTEFDLACATCGAALSRRSVPPDSVGLPDAAGPVEVAECPNCGGRYFPESALDRLG